MKTLPYELIILICEYSYNETVFSITLVNKYCHAICKDKSFVDYIIYRDHPIVFNYIDNFCIYCNLKCFIILDNDYITCKHIV